MDLPSAPQDELAQPTRARIFALLSELGRAAGTEELAERLQLHPNGVRVHLDVLENGGLVDRERVRQPRDRDVVREKQAVVCAMHRGLTRGMLDTIDPKTKLTGFVAKDPDTAGCLIQVRGPMAKAAAAEAASAPAPAPSA